MECHSFLHTPLMSVTNAISSKVIIVATIAAQAGSSDQIFNSSSISVMQYIILAAINIFGGFSHTKNVTNV